MGDFKFSRRFPYVKMPSCVSSADATVQRIIIPQGMANPSGVTIIEIPQNMQDEPAVIARPASLSDDTYNDFSPITCSSVRRSHLFPKDMNASASLGASQYSVSACSSRRSPPSPVRYATARRGSSPAPPCGSRSRSAGINKNSQRSEMRGNSSIPSNFSQNMNMGRAGGSSPKAPCPCNSMQNDTSIVGAHYDEPSGYGGFDPYVHGENLPEYDTNFAPPLCSTVTEGFGQPGEESDEEYGTAYSSMSASGLKRVLDNIDDVELSRIQHDLKDFQTARRRLLFEKKFELARRQLLHDTSNLKH